MRKVLLILGILFLATVAGAESLVCDSQTGVKSYWLEVNGVIIKDTQTGVNTKIPAQPDGSIKYDVSAFPGGGYTFRAKAFGEGDWGSDWSLPFSSVKPMAPGGYRFIQ